MVQLQISDILSDDISNGDNGKSFVITIYGRTITNQTIICNVIGFKPYFYMKVPSQWTVTSVKRFLNDIEGHVESYIKPYRRYDAKDDLQTITDKNFQKYTELYGFQCDSEGNRLKHRFLKLEFSSYTAMKQYSSAIKETYSNQLRQTKRDPIVQEWLHLPKDPNCDSYLYETNIHPLVKFIHSRNIQPADWIEIDVPDEELLRDKLYPQSEIVVDLVECNQVNPISIDQVSPFILASFDIECDSSHGDFPVANKDFKKLGIELYDAILKLYEKNLTDRTLQKKLIILCFQAAFDVSIQPRLLRHNPPLQISQVFTIDKKRPCEIWVHDFIEWLFGLPDLYNLKKRDTNIKMITNKLNQMIDSKQETIQVEGDKVIQIGTVFQRYGEDAPFQRHILVLGDTECDTVNHHLKQMTPSYKCKDKASSDKRNVIHVLNQVINQVVSDEIDQTICSPLDQYDIIVDTCETEEELLLKWSSKIKQMDPDYITGYNIFGFDFAYMLDRMKVSCSCTSQWCKSGCAMKKFLNMGKINSFYAYEHAGKRCKEVKKKISQYGSTDYNRYIHMDGRIIYDLQK